MKKIQRLGFCGTQNTGKTTLVKALAELPEFKDFYTSTERSKYLRDLGIPLNTDSSLPGQFVFLAERASELTKNKLLTDRTIWDVCAFTLSAKSIGEYEKSVFIESALLLADYYDIVFYVDPEGVEIEDNGVRETDAKYRNDIDLNIKELLKGFPPKCLVEIKGTTEERIKVVLDELNKYLSSN